MKSRLLVLFFFISGSSFSQDIRGAYISTAWVPTFTYTYSYSITVTLIVDPALGIPHPTVLVSFGDNTSATFSTTAVTNQNGLDIRKYEGVHTYAGSTGESSYYSINVIYNYRVPNIINMSNDQNQPIGVENRIFINNYTWTNTSVSIANPNPPIVLSGNQVLFDPGFSDASGDSLSFALVNCYAYDYYKPVGAAVNPTTGVLSFSKDSTGKYAFSIKATEWRKDPTNFYKVASSTYFDYTIDIPQVLGVNEINGKRYINCYPNPAKDKIHLNTNENVEQIEIINVLGEIFPVSELSLNEIDVSTFSNGVYFFRIKTSNGQQSVKFLKE